MARFVRLSLAGLIALSLLVVLAGNVQVAEAVPGFARNMDMDCTHCHTIFPQLNDAGKKFKETLGDDLDQSDHGDFEVSPDLFSALIKLRPIDKRFSRDRTGDLSKKDKQFKVRSYHESEIFVAGRTGRLFFFGELEAEDEWPDEGRPGFDVRFATGYAGFQIRDTFNLFFGYASPFVFDGNNTVYHNNVLRRDWSAAGFVPGVSQMFAVAGRKDQFTYILAFHGDDDDTEGHDPKSFSLRAAYDIGEHTVGAYGTIGKHYNGGTGESEHDYTLFGVDGRIHFGNVNVMALLGFRDEEGMDRDNNFSVEFNYIYDKWIPMVNLDTFTKHGGEDRWTQGSFGLAHTLAPNIKVSGAFEGTFDAPSAYAHKEKRVSIQIEFGI